MQGSARKHSWLAYLFLAMTIVGIVFLAVRSIKEEKSKPDSAGSTTSGVYSFAKQPTLDVDFSQLADNSPLDPSLWNFEEGNQVAAYNEEAQTYTNRPENARVEDGSLVIQALIEELNDRSYTSARLNTKGKFDFTYGKLLVVAQLPSGIGTWPAIWLRSTDGSNYAQAPAEIKDDPFAWALNGEIDIMEGQGGRPGLVFANAHTKHSLEQGGNPNSFDLAVPDASSAYHEYGVEWTPESIVFTFDGEPYHKILKTDDDLAIWPFDHDFHLVINLAMGGEWAMSLAERQGWSYADGIDQSQNQNWVFRIKSIRYYPLDQK